MLPELIVREKDKIIERWVQLIVETYPSYSSRFLLQQTDRFQNPVGYTITTETEALFHSFLNDDIDNTGVIALDNLIRVRTVQNFTAAQAVGFVFSLKQAIREVINKSNQVDISLNEILTLETRIDQLALKAFDSYMNCRDRINEIRIKDIKRQAYLFTDANNFKNVIPRQKEHETNDPTSCE